MFEYKYEMPCLTADMVIFRWNNKKIEFAVIERQNDPFKGFWALPAGFCEKGETLKEAAIREAFEEVGLTIDEKEVISVGLFDKPGRDPRGWVVTAAFLVFVPFNSELKSGSDAVRAEWFLIEDAFNGNIKLAFDHIQILEKACELI